MYNNPGKCEGRWSLWDVQKYFTALARIMDLDPDFDFDLVPVEDARSRIMAVITTEGVEHLPDCYSGLKHELTAFTQFLNTID